jgi:hypothetical protein
MNRDEKELVRQHFAGIAYDIMFYSTILGLLSIPGLLLFFFGCVGFWILGLCLTFSLVGFLYAKLILWLIKRSRRQDEF